MTVMLRVVPATSCNCSDIKVAAGSVGVI